ncbi:hypothetical protein L1987_86631 [Smallanthus sonchifolius]|uniref:Uncharacterized protein n=1 Tax=Smallanthus sonchifolius TaxID=185202 RepID=A0ACB8Y0Q3_9ASTR|nr:hypothetical protein L1987_86631 [Smallanthus sonchifolius]
MRGVFKCDRSKIRAESEMSLGLLGALINETSKSWSREVRRSINKALKFGKRLVHSIIPSSNGRKSFTLSHSSTIHSCNNSNESGDIAIPVREVKSSKSRKGAPLVVVASNTRLGQVSPTAGWRRGVGIIDLILRICAIVTTLVAAVVMGTTSQNLPFFTQFFQFFLAGNAITCAYLVLSLPFSIVCIVRPHIIGARMLLLIFDTLALALTMAAASAAAAIIYLAHNGNPNTNWPALCQQFNEFCPRVSGAVMHMMVLVSIGTAAFYVVGLGRDTLIFAVVRFPAQEVGDDQLKGRVWAFG